MFNDFKKHETLSVAFITVIAYAGSYFYERGSAIYFGVPTDLISITPASMIAMAISTFVLATVFFFASDFIVSVIIKKTKSVLLMKCAVLFSGVIFWFLIGYLNNDLTIVNVVTTFVVYVFICIYMRFMQTTPSKQDPTTKDDDLSPKPNGSKSLTNQLHDYSSVLFWVGIVFVLSTHSLGRSSAANQNRFDGFAINKDKYVIAKIYGENYIVKKVVNGHLDDGVYILKSEDFKSVNIHKISLVNIALKPK